MPENWSHRPGHPLGHSLWHYEGGQNGWGKNYLPNPHPKTSILSDQGILGINKSQIWRLEIDSKTKSSERHAAVWKDLALDTDECKEYLNFRT